MSDETWGVIVILFIVLGAGFHFYWSFLRTAEEGALLVHDTVGQEVRRIQNHRAFLQSFRGNGIENSVLDAIFDVLWVDGYWDIELPYWTTARLSRKYKTLQRTRDLVYGISERIGVVITKELIDENPPETVHDLVMLLGRKYDAMKSDDDHWKLLRASTESVNSDRELLRATQSELTNSTLQQSADDTIEIKQRNQ